MTECHCGKPIHTEDDGFTRGLCLECSTHRCDVQPGACVGFPVCRLSVNINEETAAALKAIADEHGWTITEAVRRVIAIGKFAYDEHRAGNRLHVVGGGRDREVDLLP